MVLPSKDTLAWDFDNATAVAWPEAIHLARDKSLHSLDLAPGHAGKFGNLDAPGDADLHGGILGDEFGQVVGKPWREQKLYSCGFALVLRAFEDWNVVGLTARQPDARYRSNEKAAAHRAMVRRRVGADNMQQSLQCAPRHPKQGSRDTL